MEDGIGWVAERFKVVDSRFRTIGIVSALSQAGVFYSRKRRAFDDRAPIMLLLVFPPRLPASGTVGRLLEPCGRRCWVLDWLVLG